VRAFLICVVAGLLIWGSICLVCIAYQSTHAGSFIAAVDTGLALVLTIIACFLMRLR
jgi:hypothetical protein